MMEPVSEMIPSASRVRRAGANLANGNTFTDTLYNGRTVTFKALIIPPEQVERKTTAFLTNERDQSNLTEENLSDIMPSIRLGGQNIWAVGRETSEGIIEVSDGTRRRAGVVFAGKPFKILVADLTDEEMEMISIMGNFYKTPSPIEKGRRYRRLLSKYGSQRQVEDALRKSGEKVSRRVMARCIKAAELPKAITNLFESLDDITPDFAENLHRFSFKELEPEDKRIDSDDNISDAMVKAVREASMLNFERPAELVDFLVNHCREEIGIGKPKAKAKAEPVRKSYGGGRVKVEQSNKRLKLDISDLTADQVTDIERFISMTLDVSEDTQS